MDLIIARILGLLAVAVLVAIAARRLSLPYTVGLVLAGVGLALSRFAIGVHLTHDIIFDLILPPLLFEAAINIPWRELRRDMVPVLVLSILGVVISAAVVSGGMMWLLGWPVASALVFGVLIAATDPVAVIAMFKDTGVGGRLRLLVESESLFNDGVAAVLFGLALSWAQGQTGGVASGAWSLLTISGGGVAVGLAAGALGLFVAVGTGERIVEAALTAVVAYGSFLAAETAHVSGVLATVTAGIMMGSLGTATEVRVSRLALDGQRFILELWDFAAFLANSLVFLLIGLTVARVPFDQVGWMPLTAAIALVLLGRAATVYPLALLFARSRWRIDRAEQHILWWGGLRGALALALVLTLPASLSLRDAIVIATFAVVVFSVLVQGVTMTMLLRRLKLLPARQP
ncbi:MAG TPA: sodium:proton antiporter [Rhizomicrobium sp.]|nr:sodium:proton antiporter [Rhizomicrobium sp.]